jgi:hypothetical protein
MTDVKSMVMEKLWRPSSGEWLNAVSASRKKYVNRVLYPRAMKLHHSVWSSCVEMTLEINPYELTASFQCHMMRTDWMSGNSLELFRTFDMEYVLNGWKIHFVVNFLCFSSRKFSYAWTY